MKKTVAWIGTLKEVESVAACGLDLDYRLLFLPVNKTQEISNPALGEASPTKFETVECPKEGCWEADIIVIGEKHIAAELLLKIREVATQKPLVVIPEEPGKDRISSKTKSFLQQFLPNSKLIVAFWDQNAGKLQLPGRLGKTILDLDQLMD